MTTMSRPSDKAILALHWAFCCLAILVMTIRLTYRRVAKRPFGWGDGLTMGAVICVLTRLALMHVVLIWGSSNVPREYQLAHNYTETEIHHREIGSKLSISNRFIYVT
jgi:hypothetical protein